MSLDFIGDSEIQHVKVEIPVKVTKRDYGAYEIELPGLEAIKTTDIGLKHAKNAFKIFVICGAIASVVGQITKEKNGTAKAKETTREA